MYSQYYSLKPKAIRLRRSGKTYGEIQKALRKPIPKSTLSHWFRDIHLTELQQNRISRKALVSLQRAQAKARLVNKASRERYIQGVRDRVSHLPNELRRKDSAKIALAMLYLGEGFKNGKGLVGFANSDPKIIRLFLRLLRSCYDVDETKFRVTLQCRADQDTGKLERFWCRITGIPHKQFYKAQIDPRTTGIPTKRVDYKGVCRINYLSADVFFELQEISFLLCKGP